MARPGLELGLLRAAGGVRGGMRRIAASGEQDAMALVRSSARSANEEGLARI
jgi:hypothetical protein